MDKPKTHVALVLDRSSSMDSIRQKTLDGFNEQIDQLKLQAQEGHDVSCSIVSFNGDVLEHSWNVPASEVNRLTLTDYAPSGSTALLDAIGYTLTKLSSQAKEEPDTAFLVVVLSDGETNSDRRFNSNTVRPLVESCNEDKRWTIVYVGCSRQNLEGVQRSTGIQTSNMAVAAYDNAGVGTLCSNLNANTRTYFAKRGAIGATGFTGSKVAEGVATESLTMNFCSTTQDAADWTKIDVTTSSSSSVVKK